VEVLDVRCSTLSGHTRLSGGFDPLLATSVVPAQTVPVDPTGNGVELAWPDLIRVHDAFAPYGVEFIGAAADTPDRAQAVLAYTRRYGINFPVGLGATLDQMRSVGLRPALPATVVLDERGHPLARMLGVDEVSF